MVVKKSCWCKHTYFFENDIKYPIFALLHIFLGLSLFSLGSFVLVVGQCVAGIGNAGKTPFVDRTDSGTGW